eukprot:1199055-Rhodomonas_salina.3
MPGTDIVSGAIYLRARNALPGTGMVHGAFCLAMLGTDIVYSNLCLRGCYAMSGPDLMCASAMLSTVLYDIRY